MTGWLALNIFGPLKSIADCFKISCENIEIILIHITLIQGIENRQFSTLQFCWNVKVGFAIMFVQQYNSSGPDRSSLPHSLVRYHACVPQSITNYLFIRSFSLGRWFSFAALSIYAEAAAAAATPCR